MRKLKGKKVCTIINATKKGLLPSWFVKCKIIICAESASLGNFCEEATFAAYKSLHVIVWSLVHILIFWWHWKKNINENL
jgi:hypothetical protein